MKSVTTATTSKNRSHLESLVDELIKTSPDELAIRRGMEAAGLVYTSDPIDRMNLVLSAVEAMTEKSDSRARASAEGESSQRKSKKNQKRRERDHVQDL